MGGVTVRDVEVSLFDVYVCLCVCLCVSVGKAVWSSGRLGWSKEEGKKRSLEVQSGGHQDNQDTRIPWRQSSSFIPNEDPVEWDRSRHDVQSKARQRKVQWMQATTTTIYESILKAVWEHMDKFCENSIRRENDMRFIPRPHWTSRYGFGAI